jgi:hypothetical protein
MVSALSAGLIWAAGHEVPEITALRIGGDDAREIIDSLLSYRLV